MKEELKNVTDTMRADEYLPSTNDRRKELDERAKEFKKRYPTYDYAEVFTTFCRMMREHASVNEFRAMAEQVTTESNRLTASIDVIDKVFRLHESEKMVLDGAPIVIVLDTFRMSIKDLVNICASSKARIRIAEQGYALDILSNDINEDVRIAVIRQGYFNPDAIMTGSVEVKLEAVRHNVMLPQLIHDSDLRVATFALLNLLRLHGTDICKALINFYMFPNFAEPCIVCSGNGYIINLTSCFEILKRASELL